MKKEIITVLKKDFDSYSYKKDNIEFWFARDLQKLLGYVEWRKFNGVIEKAKIACKNAGFNVLDHFVGAAKTVILKRESAGVKLTLLQKGAIGNY